MTTQETGFQSLEQVIIDMKILFIILLLASCTTRVVVRNSTCEEISNGFSICEMAK